MDLRPIWRGHLRLALVSCPVALFTARHDRSNLHFNLINPKTGNRVRMVAHDAETNDDLARSDLVKGYEFKKDQYLLMDDEDFEKARIESSSVLTIEKFVDLDSIDPIYFDASYYVAPDGEAGTDVYMVLHEAIQRTRRMALSRVVIGQRERVVALGITGRGMVAHTLHETKDLNDAAAIFDDLPTTKPDPEMVKLATQLIDRQTGKYDPADWDDRYEARLRAVIAAKLEGRDLEEEPEAQASNVVDLMEALRQSLGGATKAVEKPPAKPVTKSAAKAAPRATEKPAPKQARRK